MQDIKVSFVQSDILWNDPKGNIENFGKQIESLNEKTDLIVLPEMFSTGFNMKPQHCFETMDGNTMQWMKEKARETHAVICGSLLIKENGHFFNRLIWMRPDGTLSFYNKKHLFRMAGENNMYTEGTERAIVKLKKFNFLLQVCYDLRFPVWSRNRYHNGTYDYDGIIYVANWPAIRQHAWCTLLMARAIENQAYVIGVNRVGADDNGFEHAGNSMIISPKGEILKEAAPYKNTITSTTLSKESLDLFRGKFLAGADWDNFEIKL